MKKSNMCIGCWQHMKMPVPLGTPLSWPFKVFGLKRSQMNPNLCTMCETMFSYIMKKPHVQRELTVMFADLRGYTKLTSQLMPVETMEIIHRFYDESAQAVWQHDGIVNKFLGDGMLAVFNFPIMRGDHTQQAVEAALKLKKQCEESPMAKKYGLCVGVGIHTGKTSIGKFGSNYKEFTALGSTVNVAARVQELAAPGEVLITRDAKNKLFNPYQIESLGEKDLKGIEDPIEVSKVSFIKKSIAA